MRFTQAYSACQVCSPSRAAIQTGRAPARLKITDYIGAPQPDRWKRNTKLLPAPYALQLPLEETTIAESLREQGYRTFFAGKWHLGGEGFLPTDQGYDINCGGHEAGTPPGGYFSPYKNPYLADGPVGESLPGRLAEETARFIHATPQETPFFAMLSFYSVHSPLETTEALWRKYQIKASQLGLATNRQRFLLDRTMEVRQVQDHPLYAGMIESLDQAVGRVLQALQESGKAENTVVLFTSDNGGVSSGDAFSTSCLPMRGGKGRQWEGGIRGPLYICWPGVTTGSESPTLAIGMDLFPTMLEMAQAPKSGLALDGVSLVPVLRGRSIEERPLYWHYPHYGNQGGEPSAIIRESDWKLIHYFEDDRDELYDLSSDPSEQSDVASHFPARVASMRSRLLAWQEEVGASRMTRNLAYDAEIEASRLETLKERGLSQREAEHLRFLQSDYRPKSGWKGIVP